MQKFLKVLPFIFVFIASIYNSADLDLGWHLKYGQFFAENHKVLKVNSLSSEMADYKYPDTSWASDIFLYALFTKLGFVGITLLGALVITLTFYFLIGNLRTIRYWRLSNESAERVDFQ